jgi:hypothetical protein
MTNNSKSKSKLDWSGIQTSITQAIDEAYPNGIFIKSNRVGDYILANPDKYPEFIGLRKRTICSRAAYIMHYVFGWRVYAQSGKGTTFVKEG